MRQLAPFLEKLGLRPAAEAVLAALPLIRERAKTLVELAAQDHALILVSHHIASDGWSRGLLLRELELLYTAFVTGQQPALPAPAIQYADYALWQRERMAKGELDEQLAYYKSALAGAPAVLELPTDHPRPSVQDLRGGTRGPVMMARCCLRSTSATRRRSSGSSTVRSCPSIGASRPNATRAATSSVRASSRRSHFVHPIVGPGNCTLVQRGGDDIFTTRPM